MVVRYVDPEARRGPLTRGWHRVANTRAGRWLGINVSSRIDPWLLKRSGGRLRSVGPLPTALLTSTGAKSGQTRETPVVYFHDRGDVVLIASSFGRDKHPAWYHNLRAHPADARLNGDRYLAAEVTDPQEIERLFALAVRVYPGYADYRTRTAAIGRRIPVLRLTPA